MQKSIHYKGCISCIKKTRKHIMEYYKEIHFIGCVFFSLNFDILGTIINMKNHGELWLAIVISNFLRVQMSRTGLVSLSQNWDGFHLQRVKLLFSFRIKIYTVAQYITAFTRQWYNFCIPKKGWLVTTLLSSYFSVKNCIFSYYVMLLGSLTFTIVN
jgi:hypothetical protein